MCVTVDTIISLKQKEIQISTNDICIVFQLEPIIVPTMTSMLSCRKILARTKVYITIFILVLNCYTV